MIKFVCDKCSEESFKSYDNININWAVENPTTGMKTQDKSIRVMLCPKCMKTFLEDFIIFLKRITGEGFKYRCRKNGHQYVLSEEVEDFHNIGENPYVVIERKGRRFTLSKKDFEEEFIKEE